MEPLVKAYLKTHSFQNLEDDHGVCARFSTDGTKVSLNYDQILVKNGDLLAEQCRGMVVRPTQFDRFVFGDDWKLPPVGNVDVVAWPMNRFYNHGDAAQADVDWSDPQLRVYEKLDGTMMVVYWDASKARWHAGTRSVPEADLPIRVGHMEIGDMTFSELFFRALRETREAVEGRVLGWATCALCGVIRNEAAHPDLPCPTDDRSPHVWHVDPDKVVHLNKELTYVFELTTPYNRIVVKYDEPRVTLLAARHTATGRELSIEELNLPHVPRPQTWASLHEPVALAAFVNSSDPASLEGAVVCDSRFRRVKVKNKSWVLSSKAKDLVTVSRRSALEAILQGKVDDVLPLVEKDIAEQLESMRRATRDYFKQVDNNFVDWKLRSNGSRKEFASLVMGSGDWTPAYFNLWEGRSASALEWATTMSEAGKLSAGSLDIILSKLG